MQDPTDKQHLLIDLTRRYCEPSRHYHTLLHISYMLHAGRAFPLTEAQIWSVWFHDAVYDPRSDSNEEDSARYAERTLPEVGVPDETVAVVASIVRDTCEHIPSSEAAGPVIDLDLASLALPWDVFETNRIAIHQEYDFLDAAEFESGTRDYFTRLLARDRIFWTDWGAAYEASARANLERLLAQ